MRAFHANHALSSRLIEFLGGDSLDHATAVYVTHSDGFAFDRRELRLPCELDWFLQHGMDIARSMADTQHRLLHLDVEYVNFDAPAEAFVDPWRCFELQEPVVKAIESLLLESGIQPLHLITGQGHHFVWQIKRASEVAERISALSPAPEMVGPCMERIPPFLANQIVASDQSFFAATALLVEWLAHRVKERASRHASLPVEITAVHVGPCVTPQREMISIDISEYGDPLHTRMIRMPFTKYRKPWVTGLAKRLGIEKEIPAIRAIPLHEMDFRQALKVRQVDREVQELAHRACTRIPVQEEGTSLLLDGYLASRLRRFHEYYYSATHDPKDRWPETYERTPVCTLPHCAQHVLAHPNDLLLKPAGMQLVTRCLCAQGWHPRHVAGLIRSKFENPIYGWGFHWEDYEPGTRADFYTRLFAGLYWSGLDRLLDLNCTSTREKGFCFRSTETTCNLEPSRLALLSRMPHD